MTSKKKGCSGDSMMKLWDRIYFTKYCQKWWSKT